MLGEFKIGKVRFGQCFSIFFPMWNLLEQKKMFVEPFCPQNNVLRNPYHPEEARNIFF